MTSLIPSRMTFPTFIVLLFLTTVCFAEKNYIRQTEPKDCYLFCYGKGPNWLTPIGIEFQLQHLEHQQPFVQDRYSDPTPEALDWTELQQKPIIQEIARSHGRKIVRIDYPHLNEDSEKLDLVMLAIETEIGSDWYSPFFVASEPEYFHGRFISGTQVVFGFLATLEYSGTGVYRTHHLFDFSDDHPRLVRTVHAGRVRKFDFKIDEEYKEALKALDAEKQIFKGEREI